MCVALNIAAAWYLNGPFYSYLSYHPKYDAHPGYAYATWLHSMVALACVVACVASFRGAARAIRPMLTLVSVLASWQILWWVNELHGFYRWEAYQDYYGRPAAELLGIFWYFASGPGAVLWLLLNHVLIVRPVLRGPHVGRATA